MPGEKGLRPTQWGFLGLSGSGCQVFSGIYSLLVVTLSYDRQSEPGELGCRNTLQLLPCKGRLLLKEPAVVFRQCRRIMYNILLLGLGALWKCLEFLFFC